MDRDNFLMFVAGMRYAAMLVSSHWNDRHHMTNQYDQAKRSADSIKYSADHLTAGNIEEILNGQRGENTNG